MEYHPYVFKATEPVIQLHKKYNIVATSFGGLTPVSRFPGEALDPVLERIAKRLTEARGKSVTSGQVLQLWLRQKGIPAISYVLTHFPAALSVLNFGTGLLEGKKG